MQIVYGVALVCASVLLIIFVGKARNAPSAPRWATAKALIHLVLFCSMTAFIFGVALLFSAAADLAHAQFGAIEAVLVAVIFVASYFGWRKVRAFGRAPAAKATSGLASPSGMA